MTTADWTSVLSDVDRYVEKLFVPRDEILEDAVRDAAAAGLPPIQVSPSEGKLLYLRARMIRARRILEIGLLGGFSTLWLARALPPDGQLVTLEIDEQYAEIARKNLARAGLLSRVTIRLGPALKSLEQMVRGGEPPFDLVFIDADKENYPGYLDWSTQLTRPGGLILADNVIRDGRVARTPASDPSVRAIQQFNRQLAAHPKLEAILIPVIRHSLDGLAIARVKD